MRRTRPDDGSRWRPPQADDRAMCIYVPGDAYRVTVTTTWAVRWTGGGDSGVLTVTRSSATRVRIGELQVLVS